MSSTNDRWGVIDDQSIAEAAELIGVPLRRDRMQWNRVATPDAIRQFCAAVDDNPRWHEDGLAPPSFLYSVDATIVAPKLPGVQWIYAGTRWRWYDAIHAGDEFDVSVRFTEMIEKSGRRFGRWVLQVGEIEYRRADGGLICIAQGRVARTPRRRRSSGEEPEAEPDAGPDRATDQTIDQRSQAGAVARTAPVVVERRGAEPRVWGDTHVGDAVDPVAQPLTLERIFGWYTGAQGALHYGGAHGDAVRYRRRHDDYEVNTKTGAKDSAARGHFSSKEGKDVGMGGAYDVGLHRIAWAIAFVTDWMGDDGHLAEIDVDVLAPNLVGDVTSFSGVVTSKWVDEHSFVGLGIEGHNQSGQLTTRGKAVVALPTPDRPVALPLFGGDRNRWTHPPASNQGD